jgi:hypothetical protein
MCDGNSSGKANKRKKMLAALKKKIHSKSRTPPLPKKPVLGGWVWRKLSKKWKH